MEAGGEWRGDNCDEGGRGDADEAAGCMNTVWTHSDVVGVDDAVSAAAATGFVGIDAVAVDVTRASFGFIIGNEECPPLWLCVRGTRDDEVDTDGVRKTGRCGADMCAGV